MKKLYLVFSLTIIITFSNILVVESLTNQQMNNVAQDFYNSGASFMRAEEFIKAKDFFIYSHNEAIKAENYYLAYTANERIKECNSMLGLNVNDYKLTKSLLSNELIMPSTSENIGYERNVKLTVNSYKKYDYIYFDASKGQNIRFSYIVAKGNVSIYFMDKISFNRFKNSSYFAYDFNIGGIELPSEPGTEYNQIYTVPETGEWYLILLTNSSDIGELQMELL